MKTTYSQETMSTKRFKSVSGENNDPSLFDIVALLPSSLASYLSPEDALNLLTHCTTSLSQDVCDDVAIQGMKTFFERKEKHYGKCCMHNWHFPVPYSGAAMNCPAHYGCIHYVNPKTSRNDLWLPRRINTHQHILEAMCLVYKGIQPHCFQVLQLDRNFERRQYGLLEPVVFPLAAALNQQNYNCEMNEQLLDPIDVASLTRLLNVLGMDIGTRFFSSTDLHSSSAGMVEAHWRDIHVNLATDSTLCHFCDNHTDSMVEGPLNPQFRQAEYEFLMRQHCRDVYQPLKKFMTRHLHHVRYVRSSRECARSHFVQWSKGLGNTFLGYECLGLIAGFTSGGVLCGVYLKDIGSSGNWTTAPGAYPFEGSASHLTRLRIAY